MDEMFWIASGAALLIVVVCGARVFHAAEDAPTDGARHF